MRKFQSTMRKSQAGAALITSILILLMLTIIGVAAMQMTSMQERMAGNSRDLPRSPFRAPKQPCAMARS